MSPGQEIIKITSQTYRLLLNVIRGTVAMNSFLESYKTFFFKLYFQGEICLTRE